jgi:hypothetical protein
MFIFWVVFFLGGGGGGLVKNDRQGGLMNLVIIGYGI